jgi:hypothetical protein
MYVGILCCATQTTTERYNIFAVSEWHILALKHFWDRWAHSMVLSDAKKIWALQYEWSVANKFSTISITSKCSAACDCYKIPKISNSDRCLFFIYMYLPTAFCPKHGNLECPLTAHRANGTQALACQLAMNITLCATCIFDK